MKKSFFHKRRKQNASFIKAPSNLKRMMGLIILRKWILYKGGSKMAVKIIIKRKIPKSKETQVLPLLLELRSKAMTQPGYISGETLINVNDPEDYLVISTWKSLKDWKAWEESQERKEIQKRIEELLAEKSSAQVYYYG